MRYIGGMDSPPVRLPHLDAAFNGIRRSVLEATTRLLGDTILLTDEDWAQRTILPEWTRSHVAAHLFENARGFMRILDALLMGSPRPCGMYESESGRRSAIERGAGLSPLELQIQLDTTAGQLEEMLDRLTTDDLDAGVLLRPGLRVAARHVPLARLREVIVHHLDLGTGFCLSSVPADTIDWVLEWQCWWLAGRDDLPALRVESTHGLRATIGAPGTPLVVKGTPVDLLSWLTRRHTPDALADAPAIAALT